MSWTHVDVKEIRGETEKAFRIEVKTDDGSPGPIHWVPKKVISDPDDYEVGDKDCTVSIEEWFATKEGIEGSD